MLSVSTCGWLHHILSQLPLVKYPFQLQRLPEDGIYFFYEESEKVNHGKGTERRIVRVGTHKNGNFQSRIDQHFLIKNETKSMSFDERDRAPKDRSIFRKHLGRCLLSKSHPDYLPVWNVDFTKEKNRQSIRILQKRDIPLEKQTESSITAILRQKFAFRFVMIDEQEIRIGDSGLERKLVGTVSHCSLCKPSSEWLGKNHSDPKVAESGLWQVHYVNAPGVDGADQKLIENLIRETKHRLRV